MVRAAIESMYKGRCTITYQKEEFDATTKQTRFQDVVLASNKPCRLSYKSFTAAEQGSGAAKAAQSIKLFLAPEIEVEAGSRIIVTQNGRTVAYKASGQPAVYTNHQEIELEKADDYT